jgi:pyruvate/2-oxoglutarate dehydrogenase complex dihydrolipoamide dehydrogenase (E3) component
MLSCQYLIIGAGSTGLSLAKKLAAQGGQIILVDKSDIGGGYPIVEGFLNYLQNESRSFGASLTKFKDFPETFTVLRNHRKKIWREGLNEVEKSRSDSLSSIQHFPNLQIIKGEATFFSKSIVEVNGHDQRDLIQFKDCIIATGKDYTSKLNLDKLDTVHTINTLHTLSIVPSKVAIVGVSEQSLSVAAIFVQLGVKVYIFDKLKPSQVLPKLDRSAFNYLIKYLASWQAEFHFKTAITKIEKQPRATVLTDKYGNEYKVSVAFLPSQKEFQPKSLNLSKISINPTQSGIPTNSFGRTVYKNIWALGECSSFSNKLNKERMIQNFVDNLNATNTQNKWLSFSSSGTEDFADPRKTDYTSIDLENRLLTIGLPEHEAVKKYGSTFGSSFYQKKDSTGFIKLLYKQSMRQLLGISLTGQVSAELELVCFEWFKRGASSDYIDSYLKRLGYSAR